MKKKAEEERLAEERAAAEAAAEAAANDFSFSFSSFGATEEKVEEVPTGDFWYRSGIYTALHYCSQECDAEVRVMLLQFPRFTRRPILICCAHL